MARARNETWRHDGVLVVGAGLAGLTAALSAAPAKVLVLTEAALNQGCSSAWAQGGMAAALGADDTPALHAADTVAAGAGLVIAEVADLLASEGPAAVRRLAELGAPFDRDAAGGFAQSLEAAHSRARVAPDHVGHVVFAALDRVHAALRAGAHGRLGHPRRGGGARHPHRRLVAAGGGACGGARGRRAAGARSDWCLLGSTRRLCPRRAAD